MEYEQQAHSAHVADESIRKRFRAEDRNKKNVRLILIAGVTLSIVVAIVVILADLGIL
jgi:hypothetical protein